jgi:hypothetical protein
MRLKLAPMYRRLLLTCAIVFCFCVSASCEKQRRPCRYLIPHGYVGWVKAYFKVQNAPPLPIEDGYYLFKYPPSGILLTSSDVEEGWADDQYYYYSGETRRALHETGWGEGGLIWAGYVGQGGTQPPNTSSIFQGFFVGTEAEFNDYGRYVDDHAPGPLDRYAIDQKKKRDGIQ